MQSESIHVALRRARQAHQRAEYDLAVLLCQLEARRLYLERGHASVRQYAEVELDLDARQTRALLVIGRRLPALPALGAALAAGELGWTKAREVVRVATPETDAAWTARARHTTSRELEELVARAQPGESPPAPRGADSPRVLPTRVHLHFDCESVDAELVRRALAMLRAAHEYGPEVEDGALLAVLVRQALASTEGAEVGGAASAGERYRVVIHRCPDCEMTHVGHANGASAAAQAEAACDAECVDLTHPAARLTHVVPPATRRRVLHRYHERCAVPYCRAHLFIDLHHIVPRSRGETTDESGLLPLCPAHHRAIHRGDLLLVVDQTVSPAGGPAGDRTQSPSGRPTGDHLPSWLLPSGHGEGKGAVRFFHADGQPFGPGAEPEGRHDTADDVAARVLAVLESPGTVGEIAARAGLSRQRTAHVLACLHGLEQVLPAPTGEWHRCDKLRAVMPAWESAERRAG